MARPRKEGMDYFPHDTDAANDKKIKALRMLYGNDGYTFYFILLEMIYREPTFELDVSDAETIQILSKECGINDELFNQILQTAIKRDCFDKEAYHERQVLTSNGIKKRASVVVDKRVKMQEKHAKKVSDAEIPTETPQSKVKVKESIKDIYLSQFEEFWKLYPSKKGKAKAQTKWLSLSPKMDFEKVIEGTKAYIAFIEHGKANGRNREYKDGATFVNQESWNDEWTIQNINTFKPSNKQQPNLQIVQPTDQERKELRDAFNKQLERNGVSPAVNI